MMKAMKSGIMTGISPILENHQTTLSAGLLDLGCKKILVLQIHLIIK